MKGKKMKSYEKYINKSDVLKIHEATLKILSDTGIIFEDDKALNILKKHGVRTENNKVFFSEKDVSEALKTVPSTINLRLTSDKTVELGNGAMLRIPIGSPNYYSDQNGKIHSMNTEYAVRQFKIAESSNSLDLSQVNCAIISDTKPTFEQRIFGAQAFKFKYGNKPADTHNAGAIVDGFSPQDVYKYTSQGVDFVNRFKGIASGISCFTTINTFSPLSYHDLAIQQMFAHMDNGQIIAPTPCAMPMLTAPASLAGLLAMTNAEIIAGITFSQIYKPGTPVVYANTSGSTDMRSIQLCVGSAEAALIIYATAAMADFYNLPFRTGGALSDAKQLDAQAGVESMIMAFATLDVKPDFILHNIGCMCSFNAFSCEKFLLDEETLSLSNRLLCGFNINEETLLLNTINKVGPKGSFMIGRTPKTYRKDFYLSNIFNKDDPNNWQNNGGKTVVETAYEEVEKRISSYTTPSLDKEQEKILEPYLPKIFADIV